MVIDSTAQGFDIEVAGSGDQTVLMLHGGLGLDRNYLRPLIERLASFAKVVAYDQRGNGRSVTDADDVLSMDQLVADVDIIADATDTDRFVLYGHSYGGFVALEYATRNTARLDGLIAASTAPHVGNPPDIPGDADPGAIEAFGSLFAGPMESDEQWEQTWRTAFPLYAPDLSTDQAAAALDATTYRASAWNQAGGMLATYNVSDGLSGIDVPTLIIGGGRDFITGPAGYDEMHASIANAKKVVFADSGHFPFVSHLEAYSDAIKSWIVESGIAAS